jgi:hypothetical protein
MDAEAGAAIGGHLEHLLEAMDPWDAGRRYMNFTERPADARAFFTDGTHRRLQAVKAAYDADDVFCSNHPVSVDA